MMIITRFSTTVYLLKVIVFVYMYYFISIHIQDFRFANKWVSMKITVVSAVMLCSWPTFWRNILLHLLGSKGWASWGGSSQQPHLGMFISRPSNFSIDANSLLWKNGTVHKQAFKLSLTLNYLMCSDSLIQCKSNICIYIRLQSHLSGDFLLVNNVTLYYSLSPNRTICISVL